jgi:hypothetical protein
MKQFLRIQLSSSIPAISSNENQYLVVHQNAGDFPKFIGIVLHQMKNSPFEKEN